MLRQISPEIVFAKNTYKIIIIWRGKISSLKEEDEACPGCQLREKTDTDTIMLCHCGGFYLRQCSNSSKNIFSAHLYMRELQMEFDLFCLIHISPLVSGLTLEQRHI